MRLLLATALILLILATLAGCGGNDQPSEAKVAASLKKSVQKRLDAEPGKYGAESGMTVKDVECSSTGERAFECVGELSSGETFNSTVHVSEDGKRFVTED